MHSSYWPTWKTFIKKWGLGSPISLLANISQPLLPFAAQIMFMGMPLFKGVAWGSAYRAFLDMISDQESLGQFVDYLQEAES